MTIEKTRQIFIIGAPRSGTTFVAKLLNDSPFGVPVETHFIPKYYDRLARYGSLDKKENCTRLLRDILRERAVKQSQLCIDPTEFFLSLGRRGNRSFSNFIDELMVRRVSSNGTNNWGDKTPRYLDRFELLHELFPGALFIYLVRDGRDVCLSLLEKPWGPNNVFAAAEYWCNLNRTRELTYKLERKGSLLRIRYEDLVFEPERVVPLICRHALMNPSQDQMNTMIRSVNASSVFRWKKEMSRASVRRFDSVASVTLKRLGYEAHDSPRPIYQICKWWFRTHDQILWSFFMIRQNTIEWILIRFFNKEPFSD